MERGWRTWQAAGWGQHPLICVAAVVKLVSPEKREGALKTAAGPAFFCSSEAQGGAGTSLESAPLPFPLKLRHVFIHARKGGKGHKFTESLSLWVLVTLASGADITHPSHKYFLSAHCIPGMIPAAGYGTTKRNFLHL